MCCAVIDNFPRAEVIYEFVDRNHTIYPKGFAEELTAQIAMLERLAITDREILFMKRRCPYLPHWFYDFLRGFRYNPRCVRALQDDQGHLSVRIEGRWYETILFEVKILAIISELFYIMTGQEEKIDLDYCRETGADKARRLIAGGCRYSDMGTRRRASFAAQESVVKAMADVKVPNNATGCFVGTSNVWFAMVNDLCPIGTMAHEFICAIAAMFGPQMANHLAMQAWSATFRGALGTFLYDTYGWRIFSLNFSEDYANMFKGLRVDSGDNYEQLDKIVDKYQSLGIDPRSKQVIFSNALNTDQAIQLQQYAQSRCIPSFGIGTHFTNDIPGLRPMNIVIKLVAAKITETWTFFNDTCKMSEEPGKYTGKPEVVRRFMEVLHLDPATGRPLD